MSDWQVRNAPGHKIVFKNTKSMTTKQTPVDFIVDDRGQNGDIWERVGLPTNYRVVSNDSGCDDGAAWTQNYYLGATGKWWNKRTDNDALFDNKYGCPKIGVITGGEGVTVDSCLNPGGRYGIKSGTAKCSYSRMYHKDEKYLPTGSNVQTFSQLSDYFESSNLDRAKESWCRSGGFNVMYDDTSCHTNIGGFKYKKALVELLPNDWYTTPDGCVKFTKVGERMIALTEQDILDLFKSKINQLPTGSGTKWKPEVIKALNSVMIDTNVRDDIKTAISTKITEYCNNARPGRGLSDPVCGCKNANEGWNGSDPTKSTCVKGTEGCADVVEYVNALKELGIVNAAAPILTRFAKDYRPLLDTQACINAYASGGSETVLAPEKRPIGEPSITTLCTSIVQALDQATLSIKGNYNFKCDQTVRDRPGGGGGGGGGVDAGDDAGDDDEGDDTTTPASNNIWLWVIVGVFSLFLMLGVGASLLFLF